MRAQALVMEPSEAVEWENHYGRLRVMLLALDIRRPFNSARWYVVVGHDLWNVSDLRYEILELELPQDMYLIG